MGDTGSLPLGGALGAVAVVVKHEIVLAIVGGLFVLETVSVIVQVISFKLTGKRVFRMAPIHHHYEQLGWTEPTIVIRFWIVAVVLALARSRHLEAAVEMIAVPAFAGRPSPCSGLPAPGWARCVSLAAGGAEVIAWDDNSAARDAGAQGAPRSCPGANGPGKISPPWS